MSGYLSTLLGRAIGTPAAAVAPRMGPAFPDGRQPLGGEPSAGEAALDGAQVPPPSRERVAGPDVAPAGAPASAAAAGRRPRTAEIAPDRRDSNPGIPRAEPPSPTGPLPETAGGVPPAPTRDPVASPAKAAVRPLPARDDKDARVEVRAETRVERQEPPSAEPREAQPTLERPRAQPVLALPRAVTPHLPGRGALAQPSPDRPPRIEVRIGRVEIRRPFEPQPVQWSAPAVEAQPVTGFAELAAARRYVDRGWS